MVPASNMKAGDIPDIKRPVAIFHPNIWKDTFLSLSSDDSSKEDDEMKERAEQLKEQIREMLVVVSVREADLEDKLKLIDSIQQLGVSYHFETEIDEILEQIYEDYTKFDHLGEDDLNTVALLFRLLRQQGYQISCDIFTKFTEKNGKFKESISSDGKGILNLYEAAHMRVHGEDMLEEALNFTTRHLKALLASCPSNPPCTEVANALKRPLRKRLPRMRAREYIVIYEQDPSHNHALLTFSKLDFNLVQKLHQKELIPITRWWSDLNFSTTMPFARDRIVECYFWALGVYFEPHFNVAREILTKVTSMVTVFDDIYDAYGTFEELQIFTALIQRWDISLVNQLPQYLKFFYTALLNMYEKMDRDLCKDGDSYRIHFGKEAWKKQAEFYFKEAEWLHESYKPTFEEYLKVGSNSAGYGLCATSSLIGMGDIATKEVFEWSHNVFPKIVEASNIIARLMDDVVSHKFEQQRDHIESAVECYTKQYGCSEEEAYVELRKQVLDAWKDINEECLHPKMVVPRPILLRVLNLARVIDMLYLDEDGFTHAQGTTKILINSILVDPVPLYNNH